MRLDTSAAISFSILDELPKCLWQIETSTNDTHDFDWAWKLLPQNTSFKLLFQRGKKWVFRLNENKFSEFWIGPRSTKWSFENAFQRWTMWKHRVLSISASTWLKKVDDSCRAASQTIPLFLARNARRCCFQHQREGFTIEYHWIMEFGRVEAIAKLLQISGLIYKLPVDIWYI